jgi:pilus assembly protein CpaB
MRGRALVVVLALILATLATAGVFLYARGVEEDAKSGGTMVPVIVSKVDIPARSDLNELIKAEEFKLIEVPQAAVVGGSVTSLDQLRDKHNSVAILAGEQIPIARIAGTVPGGALAIPEGMQAINVSLDSSRSIAGVINTGDHVAIYATFRDVPETLARTGTGRITSNTTTVTIVLVPTAEVLAVYRPVSGSVPGSTGEASEQLPSSVQITLALTPDDAQNMVFTMESGNVWFGLLPPDESGKSLVPISYPQVIQ